MKMYRYDELLSFSYDQIERIADGSDDFQVVADQVTGSKIERFIANETALRRGARTLRDRIRYFVRGLVGLTIPGFMPIWNKAVLNGYQVTCEARDSEFLVFFRKFAKSKNDRE